ncbi:neuropilin-2-like isoform X1 [Lates japonicus]|uniref:Neuropilin-2-like isoform X1 n=1 Tax=Lates japonicus TaxID=270547 RepID=A0AAD3MSY9_LATJO|nr:neuropilin-2-like isoform X1 [Lates japonicus]
MVLDKAPAYAVGFMEPLTELVTDRRGYSSESCGGYLDASDAGYITTPGYPLEYPPHQNCRWVITAPEPSQRTSPQLLHFEIEN